MPCLLLVLSLAFPRLVLVLLFFFSTFLQRAYHGLLLPLVGFFVLPLTTLVYAWVVNSGGTVTGMYLVVIVICVVADLGLIGHGATRRR